VAAPYPWSLVRLPPDISAQVVGWRQPRAIARDGVIER
jgi:hypothetical protein